MKTMICAIKSSCRYSTHRTTRAIDGNRIRAFASDATSRFRLDVAIVGAPNAGKSQLLNQLTGSNVAAVSRKRHTTRETGVLGVRTDGNTQLVFLDTPGFMTKNAAAKEGVGTFQHKFSKSASNEIRHADYTLIVVDAAKKLTRNLQETLVSLMLKAKHSTGRAEESPILPPSLHEEEEKEEEDDLVVHEAEHDNAPKEKFAIVLNKVDLVNPKNKLLDVAMELGSIAEECILYNEEDETVESENTLELLSDTSPPIFYISARRNDGVDDILEHLKSKATPSEGWIVDSPDQATDLSPLERIQEVIREKIYRCLHREVPHAVQQVNRIFTPIYKDNREEQDSDDRQLKAMVIHQDLVVRTKSHHRLLLGKGGMTLKRIQSTAQRDLQQIFHCQIMLRMHVKRSKKSQQEPLDSQDYGLQSEYKL